MPNAITFNADAALAKLEAAVATHGPEAVNIASEVVRINAVNDLMSSAGFAVVSGVCFYAARVCFNYVFPKNADGQREWDEDAIPAVFGLVISWLLGAFIFCACALPPLFTAWTWVALFNPKLALAHDLYAKLIH